MKSTSRLEITRNDLDVDRQIQAQNDKKVKSNRRKSLLDDNEFLAEFCDLCLDGSASDRLTTLVGKGIFDTSPFGS